MVLENVPGDVGGIAGQILIGGSFTEIQPRGAPTALVCSNIARLNPDGSPDREFSPKVNGQVYAMALQPDGANPPKVIVVGAFSAINGVPCSNIARLNPNGTLDTTFVQPVLAGNYNTHDVYTVEVEPDGWIVLGGQFTSITYKSQIAAKKAPTQRLHIARLKPDGELDPNFDPEANAAVLALAVQPNGAIVVAGGFTTLAPGAAKAAVAPVVRNHIARVTNNGTLDSSFNPDANKAVSVLTLQPDGKILIGGNFDTLQPGGTGNVTTSPDFARLNADGTLDKSFTEPNPTGQVYAITLQPDGRILVGGNFYALQPTSTTNIDNGEQIIRLNPDGTLDEPFVLTAAVNGTVNAIVCQADNQVVIAGNFNQINAPSSPTLCGNIARFDTNGLEDVTFDPSLTNNVLTVAGQPSTHSLIIGGSFTNIGGVTAQFIARINANGQLDPNFNPQVNGPVSLIVVEPDNSILIAGTFNTVGGSNFRNGLARLNPDGSIDPIFNPRPNVNGSIGAMLVQSNGQIVLGGTFTYLQPNLPNSQTMSPSETQMHYIARLNADGSLDASFDPEADADVLSIAQQADGKLIIGGAFTGLQPGGGTNANASLDTIYYVARLNKDGTVDQSFNPNPNSQVEAVAIQADGKVLLGGTFNFLSPNFGPFYTEDFIARVNTDGSVDPSFDSPTLGNAVNRILVGTDAKIYVGGLFGTAANVGTNYYGAAVGNFIVRLNANGTQDTSYAASLNGPIEGLFLQTDDTMYVAGDFTASGTVAVSDLVHFTSSGALDPTFSLSSGSASFSGTNSLASATVTALALEPGGQTIAGGNFPTGIGGQTSTNLLRVNMNGAPDLAFNPNPNGAVNAIATLSSSTPLSTQVSGLIWLNADGTPRITFQFPTDFQLAGNVATLAVDTTNGWIYIGGGYSSNSNGKYGSNLNRFSLTTGELDTTFNPNPQEQVDAIAVQPDGNIVIGGNFTTILPKGATTPVTRNYVARIFASPGSGTQAGTVDPSFDPNLNGVVSAISVLSNGQVLLGGDFTTEMPNGTTTPYAIYYLALFNSDATLVTKFNPSPNGQVFAITPQTDGKIVIGGEFTTMQANNASNATYRQYIARLNSDGSLDTNFDPEANSGVATIVEQSDGKLLVGGQFTTFSPGLATQTVSSPVTTVQRDYLARLNTDGTVDATFNPNPNNAINSISLASDGSSIFVGGDFTAFQATDQQIATPRFFLALLAQTGAVVSTFDPVVNSDVVRVASQTNGSVLAIGDFTASQPNGTVIVGGDFVSKGTSLDTATGKQVPNPCIGDVAANYLAELREDGTANANFLPDPDGPVSAVAIQTDSKIIVGGAFKNIQSNNGVTTGATPSANTQRHYIARLNSDGTLDTAFDPEASDVVDALALQGNGDVLIGGKFTTLQPNKAVSATSRAYLARLLSSGAVDPAFTASLPGPVNAIAVQPDGRILVAGASGTTGYLVRLNSNGSTDSTFSAAIHGTVNAILLQAAGGFTASGGVLAPTYAPSKIASLSSSGLRILIGGAFSSVDGTACNNLARLMEDGSLDLNFNPNADGAVNAMQMQPDGRLFVAGAFNQVGGQPRFRLARLGQISTFTERLGVSTDLSSALFTIDGGPEYSQVVFQLSTDDSTWTNLGQGTRVGATSDWLLTGITSIPMVKPFYLRMIADEPTNQFGSSGLVLFTSAFPAIVPTTDYSAVATSNSISAVVGRPFVYNIGATNAPIRFAATGLPPGLSIDAATGMISGTPTAAGSYRVTLALTNQYGTADTTLILAVGTPNNAAPVDPPARLISLSGSDFVDASHAFVAGFYVVGGAPKSLLLRAAGPSLKTYGVSNPMARPQMMLYNSSGKLLLTAGAWGGSSSLSSIFAELGAFPYATGSADSAVVTTLAPGGYTIVVQGIGSPIGNTVVEVYDADYNRMSLKQRLVYLSGRGGINGDTPLVNGIWIEGTAPKTVLIRGLGPALASIGITDPLVDPVLDVYGLHGRLLASNKAWGTQASVAGSPYPSGDKNTVVADSALALAPAFAANSKDTAVVLTLPPGGYTTQITSAGGNKGTAKFEVYEVPSGH
jgi:uncharacterized delta-60 repeat protein